MMTEKMNEESTKQRKGIEILEKRATNVVYKRAIIQAIDELQDFNLRSNIDAIRRHVQSSFGPKHIWNDTIFLKTLKSLTNDGDIEQCTSANCALSPEFKKRRTKSLLEKRSQLHPLLSPQLAYPFFTQHHEFQEKELPAKKPDHFKLKIIPKKIYDGLHKPVKNPMDTH